MASDFYAWLGDTLTSHYGAYFQEHGFDSLEVLAQLTDQQVQHMMTHYIPITKAGHRFHFENRLALLRQQAGSHIDGRPQINWPAPSVAALGPGSFIPASSRRPRATTPAVQNRLRSSVQRNTEADGVAGAAPPPSLTKAPAPYLHDPIATDFKPPDEEERGIRGRSSSAIEHYDPSAPHDVMMKSRGAAPPKVTGRPTTTVLGTPRRPLSSLMRKQPQSPNGLIKSPLVKAPTTTTTTSSTLLGAQTPERPTHVPGRYPFVSPPSANHNSNAGATNAGREASAREDGGGAYDKLLAMLHAAPALSAAKRASHEDASSRSSPSRLYF